MFVFLTLLWPSPATAQEIHDPPVTVLEGGFGWGGRFRPGRWSPAWLTLQATEPAPAVIEWYVPRPGREAMRIRLTATLNPRPRTYLAVLPVGPSPAAIHARVIGEDGRTLAVWPEVPADPAEMSLRRVESPLFIGIAGGGLWLQEVLETAGVNAELSSLDLFRLPRAAVGYESLDILVLGGVDLHDIPIAAQQAILRWVNAGGTLWLWLSSDPLPETAPLVEALADRPRRTRTIDRDGEALVAWSIAEDSLAPVVQQGQGQIVFFAADPAQLPAEVLQQAATDLQQRVVGDEPVVDLSAFEAHADPDHSLLKLWIIALIVVPIDWLATRISGRRVTRVGWLPGLLILIGVGLWTALSYPTAVPASRNEPASGVAQRIVGVGAASDLMSSVTSQDERGIWWKSEGFDRTEGPLRDLPFIQTPEGMLIAGDGVIHVRGLRYDPEPSAVK